MAKKRVKKEDKKSKKLKTKSSKNKETKQEKKKKMLQEKDYIIWQYIMIQKKIIVHSVNI